LFRSSQQLLFTFNILTLANCFGCSGNRQKLKNGFREVAQEMISFALFIPMPKAADLPPQITQLQTAYFR